MIKGKITISRVNSNRSGDYISISVRDCNNIPVIEIHQSVQDFGMAVTGMAFMPCSLDIGNIECVGKTKEVKTETIEVSDIPYSKKERHTFLQEIVKPFEIDGWKADIRLANNWHLIQYRDCKKFLDIHFERFLEKTDEEVDFKRFLEKIDEEVDKS